MEMEIKLRPWNIEDAESLVENANNFEIARFMSDAFPYPYTIEHAKNFIAFATKDDPIHIFAIEMNGKAAGGIGIHPQADIMKKNAELGYWLLVSDRHQDALAAAQEVFLCNAVIGVWPVRQLGARAWPVGPVTRKVQANVAEILGS